MIVAPLECLPCLCRKAVDQTELSKCSDSERRGGVEASLYVLAMSEPGVSTGVLAGEMFRVVGQRTSDPDPCRAQKAKLRASAWSVMSLLRTRVETSPDPFAVAVQASAAGNALGEARAPRSVAKAMRYAWKLATTRPPRGDGLEGLREAVGRARRILFIADNVGELLWDSLLIERLPRGAVTVLVRREPYWQDAMAADAIDAGFGVEVQIAEHTRYAQVHRPRMPDEAMETWLAGFDLVIAKGPENMTFLERQTTPARRFGLLVPLCPLLAGRLGVRPGEPVVAEIPLPGPAPAGA